MYSTTHFKSHDIYTRLNQQRMHVCELWGLMPAQNFGEFFLNIIRHYMFDFFNSYPTYTKSIQTKCKNTKIT
jgi:hypothetical protein